MTYAYLSQEERSVLRFTAQHHEVKVSSILNGKIDGFGREGLTRDFAKQFLDNLVHDGFLASSKPAQVYIYQLTDQGQAAVKEVC